MAGDIDSATELLRIAVEAAARRDERDYLVHLLGSHVLDGIIRDLERRWPGVDGSMVEAMVAEAADALYSKLAGGSLVRSPAGFLWRTANNKLVDYHHAEGVVRESFELEQNQSEDSMTDEPDREVMRAEAIRFARSVLPSLGQTTVVQVMSFIIDCIEQGELYIDNKFIGDAIGLTPETVRKAKYRGFERLEREARRRGVVLDSQVAEMVQDDDEPSAIGEIAEEE